MSVKTKLLALFDLMATEEAAFIERLSDAERQAMGAPDHWSAKDILAHIAHWDNHLLQSMDLQAKGETPPRVGDVDQANTAVFQAHRDEDWGEVMRFFQESRVTLRDRVQVMSEAETTDASQPWLDGRPLWWRIAHAFSHSLMHLAMYSIDHGYAGPAVQRFEAASEQLLTIDASSDWQGTTLYNLACCYSLAGQADKAVARLKVAFGLRPDLIEWSKEDPDLNPLRSAPSFQQLF
ncbi:MAG: ClbS/DfsB family four-helix bundle protein [Chloroflexi bacterium]|nr:ClbS/DfsB family four-helix bundle protein [Chloroflexota bacterium]